MAKAEPQQPTCRISGEPITGALMLIRDNNGHGDKYHPVDPVVFEARVFRGEYQRMTQSPGVRAARSDIRAEAAAELIVDLAHLPDRHMTRLLRALGGSELPSKGRVPGTKSSGRSLPRTGSLSTSSPGYW